MRRGDRRRADEAACVLFRPAAFGPVLHQRLSGGDHRSLFLDGHVSAVAFFGGVPLSILYDNLKIAGGPYRKPLPRENVCNICLSNISII
jgi:hypothetical protein